MPDTAIVDDPGALDKLATALAKAQAAIVPPKKSHTAKVPTKAGGSYSYTYSTLDDLVDALRQPLAANGLSYIQRILQADRSIGVETQILHTSGQWISCGGLLLPSGDTPQAMGSALTYARRYSLSAAFGVASEDDDDAGTAQRAAKFTPPPADRKPEIAFHEVRPIPREAGDEPDDPFGDLDDEDRQATALADRTAAPPPLPPAVRRGMSTATISEGQQKRLFAISMKAGWSKDGLREFLTSLGFAHSKDIHTGQEYEDVVAAIEAGPRA